MNEKLISEVPLFAGLPAAEVRFLAETLQLREFPAGAVVFREGGRDDRFYILLEGEVEVFKAMSESPHEDDPALLNGGERTLARLKQGAMIGEMSLFSRDGRHTAGVRALTPLQMLEMTRADFDALLHRQPAMTYDLVRLLSQRLERSENVTIRDLQEKNRQLTEAYLELKAAQAEIVEKKKLEHELELARDIQMRILPESTPSLGGYNFGALMVPARAVGGDFYDFISLDDRRMGVVVGDVSDKGMPAAMYMSLSYSLIRAEARRNDSPAEVLRRVNRHLLDISTSGMFVTVLYGVLDQISGEFCFARAGHEYPIVLDGQGRQVEVPRTTGRLMGLFDELELVEQSITFPPGGAILIFSDGLNETADKEGRQFGVERSTAILSQHLADDSRAQAICYQLLWAVQAFGDPNLQQDDVTIVAIRGMG